MSRQLPIEDTEPWYRQFWPWFIIALPTTVVIAAFATLYIANRHSDDMVVDEYYKEGLAINQRLAKQETALALNINAELEFSDADVTARVAGENRATALRLLLSHPMEADRDLEIILSRVSAGEYRGQLPYPIGQRWHWSLIRDGDPAWRLDGTLSLD